MKYVLEEEIAKTRRRVIARKRSQSPERVLPVTTLEVRADLMEEFRNVFKHYGEQATRQYLENSNPLKRIRLAYRAARASLKY